MKEAEYREFTLLSLLVGALVGTAMCVAFVYAALKLSFTLGGSTIGAIVGFAALRWLGRGRGSILEVNQVQTGASAVNIASAGVAFTLPALFLIKGSAAGFPLLPAIFAAIAGTVLGLVAIIPLRKQMIEMDRLRFPSGLAVASILRTPGESADKARLLAIGAVLSALVWYCADREWLLFREVIDLTPGHAFGLAFSMSLMNIGAGMLAGRGGLPLVAGAVLAWWIVAPAAAMNGWAGDPPDSGVIYGEMLQPLGIGVLVGGALMSVLLSWPAIKAAITALMRIGPDSGSAARDEVPASTLVLGLALGVTLLFLASWLGAGLSVPRAVLAAVVGTIWLALAGLVVAQATGMTDISPISGMALIGVTLMLVIVGNTAIVAAVLVGAAVSIGAGQCADMMQDLKTGHLVGARPVRQQLTQILLTWFGPIVAIATVWLLWQTPDGSPGFGAGTKLPAPQAEALTTTIEAIRGGDVPVAKYGLGALLGASISILPFAGVGVLIGLAMYLPVHITLSYGVGCLITMAFEKARGSRFIGKRIVPLAAGFILGEALMSVWVTLWRLAMGGA